MTSLPNNYSEARMKRGLELLEKGTKISEQEDGSFSVPSLTSSSVYEIRLIDKVWVCSCPDFENREVESCKHIYAVRFWITTNTYLQNKPKPKVLDNISCDKCGSVNVIKFGFDCKKQTYYCKDCQHKFRQPSLLKKAKFTPELISLTLDLYFSGLSLRKIARNVSDHFDIDINFSTIYDWIERYIPIISQYVNSLTPRLSDTWHADELFMKMHGGQTYKGKANLAFLWNVMDRKTRFLLASKVSEARDINGAVAVFREAVKNANGQTPNEIHTDALRAYREGISQNFKDVDHIPKCGINKPHADNNRVERLNATIRERTKVVRAWKKHKTPLAEGQRIQYNFVKPHQALDGQTPARKAGIVINGKNKWMDLLELGVKNIP